MAMHRSWCRILLSRSFNGLNRYATKANSIEVRMDGGVEAKIAGMEMKHRKHPGRMPCKTVLFPERFAAAMAEALVDRAIGDEDVKRLCNHLACRHPPREQWQVDSKADQTRAIVDRTIPLQEGAPEQIEKVLQSKRNKLFRILLKKQVYLWKSIDYDAHTAHKYLRGRAAPEYSVLVRIFNEIVQRDPSFQPETFFDFGSGVGTGIWAVNSCWERRPKEYFTVDVSPAMNELARNLLNVAYDDDPVREEHLFQRQFLPSSPNPSDLVLCAYSLFELPDAETRLRTALNLWRRTGKYLVLVEHGTNAGYGLVCEARDFILSLKEGHAFAPCPHDAPCPRLGADGTPCNFEVKYFPPKLGGTIRLEKERFSYVILRKGGRPDDDPRWPRLVRHPLMRSNHTICRMCCADGRLKEVIMTKHRHGKTPYKCARSSDWGDLLPISVNDAPPESASEPSDECDSNTKET